MVLHRATCFLPQHFLWSVAYSSKRHGVTYKEAAFPRLLKINCCSNTAQFLSLGFKLLLLLSQHLFLNHQIKGHNHNYVTSTDKISPPPLITVTVTSTVSCPLHFGEHLGWFWSQWEVTGSATDTSLKVLAPVWAAAIVCITYFHACTLGPFKKTV